MPSPTATVTSSHLLVLLLVPALLVRSGTSAASLRDHRLRGAESNAPVPNEDMLKALQYIQSLRQNAKPQDQREAGLPRSTPSQQSEGPGQEDKSEKLLQAILSTLQQTEKAAKPAQESLENAKAQVIMPHKEMPLLFEDDEKEDGEDGRDSSKRTNENVEEKYTPQNLATLQSVFDELGKMNFNSKRENGEEDEGVFATRDAAYDDGDWDRDEENRHEIERALDYLEDDKQENTDRFRTKRSDDQDEGEMANMVDFYLLKVLERTEEEEQKKRELEEEEEEEQKKRELEEEEEEEQKKRELKEEEEEEQRMERGAAEFRNNIDPKMFYRLLQISQKYQIPPEDLVDMLRTGEITRLKVAAPVYGKKTLKKPEYLSKRPPTRQKTPDEMKTERILKILGLSGDENAAQSPFRKSYKSAYARPESTYARPESTYARPESTYARPESTYARPESAYARPVWRHRSSAATRPQQEQRFQTELTDDYDNTENQLATFMAARMLSKYPTYRSKTSQKRAETEEEAGSFEMAIRHYFDRLESGRNENRASGVEKRRAEGFDNEDVMKLLSFVNPEEPE
ncbi:secretogranin-2a [Eucyclogobius newberryi]|uniref:secretogranin-2a n=1 Tax=Eucyclogobius newberryi TaxID=166745 RepID=UPI003B594E18